MIWPVLFLAAFVAIDLNYLMPMPDESLGARVARIMVVIFFGLLAAYAGWHAALAVGRRLPKELPHLSQRKLIPVKQKNGKSILLVQSRDDLGRHVFEYHFFLPGSRLVQKERTVIEPKMVKVLLRKADPPLLHIRESRFASRWFWAIGLLSAKERSELLYVFLIPQESYESGDAVSYQLPA